MKNKMILEIDKQFCLKVRNLWRRFQLQDQWTNLDKSKYSIDFKPWQLKIKVLWRYNLRRSRNKRRKMLKDINFRKD